MGACQCNKKEEEEEIKAEEKVEKESNPAMINEFNLEEYENDILEEKKESEDDVITNLESNIIKENNKLIFKKKVKVLLNKGEESFKNAANELRQMNPMGDLKMKNEIAIPLPLSKEEINDNALLINQVNIIRQNYNINVYFKNMIKNPEIAVLLLIVDDSVNNPGAKRKAILNPFFKNIGINSNFIGNTFVSFFSFSK